MNQKNCTQIERVLLILFLGVSTLWVWSCFCVSPSHGWNAVRLAPTVMWWHGINPYPGPHEGPLTTWIYGPIPLIGASLAALSAQTIPSLLIATATNIVIVLLPLGWAIWRLAPPQSPRRNFLWAAIIALLGIQNSTFIFLQADNWVTACGLIMIGLIARTKTPSQRVLWASASLATLALWCKPTALGPVIGLLGWVGINLGWRELGREIGRCAITGGLTGVGLLLLFDPAGLIFNMFVLPSRIPWVNLVEKMTASIYLAGVLALLVAPLLIVVLVYGLRRASSLRNAPLAVWLFLASVPFNIAGFATTGGNLNSLHAVNFLLPLLGIGIANFPDYRTAILRPCALAGVSFWLLAFQLGQVRTLTLVPQTQALQEGLSLARQLRDQVYFPWNPLLNFEVSGRFEHAEDGIMTRGLTGELLNLELLRRHLPPRLSVIARQKSSPPGVLHLILAPEQSSTAQFGHWSLTHWQSVRTATPAQPGDPP